MDSTTSSRARRGMSSALIGGAAVACAIAMTQPATTPESATYAAPVSASVRTVAAVGPLLADTADGSPTCASPSTDGSCPTALVPTATTGSGATADQAAQVKQGAGFVKDGASLVGQGAATVGSAAGFVSSAVDFFSKYIAPLLSFIPGL